MVDGFAGDRYAAVRAAFAENLAGGVDVGAALCMTVDGETVVDLWGGFADAAATRPWQRDTIVNTYSTTKTVTALVALLLADRGELDFDAPVARYWPEFAANGKQGVTVGHVMSHSAGLPAWREPMRTEDLYDWEKATALLAAQASDWEPGTACGYHGLTQGYLIGEVVRRITGRSLGTVLRDELTGPLDADFHIGLPASEEPRVAELIAPPDGPPPELAVTDLQLRVATNPGPEVSQVNSRAWRAAEIPAAGGTGNARAVARLHTVLATGGVAGGRRFMSETGCRRALDLQVAGRDLVLGMPLRFGMGFALGDQLMANPGTLYWGGYGGSLTIVDLDARTTFCYVMNKMSGAVADLRGLGLAMAAGMV
ncbi:serine hydrolase domain-containing protein [Dactylosporangium sp. AC04546]|uniref:serine hydrolase domain-containing protein n=1 Tax=Dactylosporangium sp. AC04546 TaxID=2862460 RepID=UPI001EDD8702|nr:serine hydrolase domain-containing protein [Dactylosporangium sp. AC04546]WVK84919.1 serine hydrolase domain-containing protein [Dactylosporangium sp. AC04546]